MTRPYIRFHVALPPELIEAVRNSPQCVQNDGNRERGVGLFIRQAVEEKLTMDGDGGVRRGLLLALRAVDEKLKELGMEPEPGERRRGWY